MSLRQVRKILPQEKREETEEIDEEISVKNRFQGFEDSEEEQESEEEVKQPIEEKPKILKRHKQKKKKKILAVQDDINFDEFISEISSVPLPEEEKVLPCLKRSAKHFDSSHELQKMFHEKVKSKSSSHQKSLILTPGLKKQNFKINYLPSMEYKNSLFTFEMSKGYLKLYQDYLFTIESNDLGMLHMFTNKYPFHIEALFQMALVYKMQAKYEQVFQLVETILYAFQMAFHHQFSPIGRNIQMDMNSTSLNKVFFKVLFMMIDCLGRKGCYRSALEFCKFLLCLDYKDPMGVLMLIDFYAISTKKLQFYLDFCTNFTLEHFGINKGLMLPSSFYSLALCKAVISNTFEITQDDVNRAFTINNLSEVHKESANVILLCAVATFPAIAQQLFAKLAPSYVFAVENEEISFDCATIAEIYAVRCLELWRNDTNIVWLKQAAEEVEVVGVKDYREVWEYSHLDLNDFSFSARTLIPNDLAFGK